MAEEKFKVLSLNCWGVFIPHATVRKDDRLSEIAKCLSDGRFDIILLQEIWTDVDYMNMCDALKAFYQNSVYYHSRMFGAGICIFSKWRIQNTFFHQYSLNGYPHYFHQGDWLAGKGIGMARLISPKGFHLNVYTTHLIARYQLNRDQDGFEPHRITQLMEMMHVVHFTALTADAVIITGDFNSSPDTPCIQMLRQYLGLSDAWLDHAQVANKKMSIEELELEGTTCDRLDHPYGNQTWAKFYGNGERLDYIFYRAGPGPNDLPTYLSSVKLTCNNCWLDMGKVPDDDTNLHYSDHEAVAAQFTMERRRQDPEGDPVGCHPTLPSTIESLTLQLIRSIDKGIKQCQKSRILYSVLASMVFILFVIMLSLVVLEEKVLNIFSILICTLLGSIGFMLFWGIAIGTKCERHALQNARINLEVILKNPLDNNVTLLNESS